MCVQYVEFGVSNDYIEMEIIYDDVVCSSILYLDFMLELYWYKGYDGREA